MARSIRSEPAAGHPRLIDNSGVDVVVSSVSGFEIAIKKSLGKLEAPDDLELQLDDGGFTVLPLSMRHGLVAGALPMHHRDPFDRLLIAQAQCEGLTLVTAGPTLAAVRRRRPPSLKHSNPVDALAVAELAAGSAAAHVAPRRRPRRPP